jgi:hypothetical protein
MIAVLHEDSVQINNEWFIVYIVQTDRSKILRFSRNNRTISVDKIKYYDVDLSNTNTKLIIETLPEIIIQTLFEREFL